MVKIMILAGGHDQAAFIKELRKKITDVYIIVVDMNPNVLAAQVADKFFPISTMDLDAVRKVAIEEKVDYIMTACGDQPILTMGILSEELGLPCYLTKQQVLNLTNKKNMKRMMVENGIPTSKYKSFSSNDIIDDSGLEYPLIVKPADSNGSKGVRKILSKQELFDNIGDAFKFSLTNTIILEEFNEGEEISCDFYILDGKAYEIQKVQSNKFKANENVTSIIYQSIVPAPFLTENARLQLNEIAQKIIKPFGLENTPLHLQAIVNGDKVRVLEFSARIGGGAKYLTIQNSTGFNMLHACMLSMLGEKPDIPVVEHSKKCYSRCHFYTVGGMFESIEGIEELMKNGIIDEFIPTKPFGVLCRPASSSGDRIGSIWITANNYTDLKNKILKAVNTIKVINENGDDILDRSMYLGQVDYSELV
ncbi:MAG: ATP-grasp domain-containing protein [Prevotella sp.]|nr:ATP-grasp domain-containing protein [Prevotella sp.]